MAQPPNTSDIFLREVDENLRRDQMRDFARKYGSWMIAGLILFLIACGAFIYWQQYRERRGEQQVEALSDAYKDIGSGNLSSAPQKLQGLADNGPKAVRASALFTLAAIALEKNDTAGAIAKYKALANDDGMPQPYRDAALLRQTSLEFDRLKPDEVISRLQPLAKQGNPWFGTAGELTAAALFKQGKKAEAGQLASSLGVETGTPMPAAQ